MENSHAVHYHMRRILLGLADEAAEGAKHYPFHSELSARDAVMEMPRDRCSDEELRERLRYQIKCAARLLLMVERRTGKFG